MVKIKQINGYWVDEDDNRWDYERFTEKEAEKASQSLVNCFRCTDCNDCVGCQDCEHCNNCEHCNYCNNCYCCHDCLYCDKCTICFRCYRCHLCRNCDNCHNCRNCNHCHNCNDCNNYKQNPRRYTTSKIDSRNDQTTFYYGETESGMEVQIICGCFRGGLEDFEKSVLETHKDNNLYREQYLKEIEKVKVLFELV